MPMPVSQHDLGWYSDPGSDWGGVPLPDYTPEMCCHCHEEPANERNRWGRGLLCDSCEALVCPDCRDALKHAPEAQRCVSCEAQAVQETLCIAIGGETLRQIAAVLGIIRGGR